MQSGVYCILWGNITYFLTLLPWDKVKVKVTQSCLTLCDPMDYKVPGILQPRILEWVAFPFSRGSSQPRDWTQVSCIAGKFLTSWATRGSPRILKWVVYPFSSGSSPPRNWTAQINLEEYWTEVSCIADGFFTSWETKKSTIPDSQPGKRISEFCCPLKRLRIFKIKINK